MNQDVLKGKWMQLKGEVRTQWGKLTNDDLDQIQGNSGEADREAPGTLRLRQGQGAGGIRKLGPTAPE